MAKKKMPPEFLANIKKAKAGKTPSKKAAAKGGRKSTTKKGKSKK